MRGMGTMIPRNGSICGRKAYRETKKQINGRYYTFDANGVMKDKWAFGTPSAPDYSETGITSAAVAFYNEDEGDLQSKWVYTYAPDDPDESGDEVLWGIW